MKKRLDAPIAKQIAPPTGSPFDPSKESNQAKQTARNLADATAVAHTARLLLLVIVGIALAIVLKLELQVLGLGLATSLFVVAAWVYWRWSETYADALREDTRNVRKATWTYEEPVKEAPAQEVPDPFRNIKIRKRNDIEEIVLSMPAGSTKHEPIMQGWPVSKSDLFKFLEEAERKRGLQERNWVGQDVEPFYLASGKQVTGPLVRELQKSLAEHNWASKRGNAWQLDIAVADLVLAMQQ